jgi:hypothetical protein
LHLQQCPELRHIQLVGDAKSIKKSHQNSYFEPLFTYAVFGEEEKVKGF